MNRGNRISNQAKRIVMTAFGGVSTMVVVIAVGMLVLLGFATDSLRDLLHVWLGKAEPDVPVWLLWVQVGFFSVALVVLIFLSRKYVGEPEYTVIDRQQQFSSGLVQSLSFLGTDERDVTRGNKPDMDAYLSTPHDPDEVLVAVPKAIEGSPWAQNISAILQAGPDLKYLGVIASSGETSSFAQLDSFKRLVERFAPQVTIIHDAEGVDFDETSKCRDAWLSVAVRVEALMPAGDPLVVDITSGTKQTTVTGTMLAMKPGRRLAYVTRRKVANVWEVDLVPDS